MIFSRFCKNKFTFFYGFGIGSLIGISYLYNETYTINKNTYEYISKRDNNSSCFTYYGDDNIDIWTTYCGYF